MKKRFSTQAVLFLGLILLTTSVPAVAQEGEIAIAQQAGLEQTILGLGAAFVPDYEGSDDYEAVPLIQARLNWADGMYLGLLGNTLRANLVPDKKWNFGPMVRYRKERKDVDNDKVDALRKVDAAVELGLFGAANIDKWSFMLTAAQDAADGHDGFVVDLSGAYRIPFNKQMLLTLFASTTYASDDYMEAYFEIDADNAARSGLQTFNADGGLKDVAFGSALQYNFNAQWGLLGVIRCARLLSDAEDSPVVDEEGDANQWLGGVAVNYRW